MEAEFLRCGINQSLFACPKGQAALIILLLRELFKNIN